MLNCTKGREENLWSCLAFKKVSEINYIVWVSLFKEQAAAAAPAKILGLQQMKWMQGTGGPGGSQQNPRCQKLSSVQFIPVGFRTGRGISWNNSLHIKSL